MGLFSRKNSVKSNRSKAEVEKATVDDTSRLSRPSTRNSVFSVISSSRNTSSATPRRSADRSGACTPHSFVSRKNSDSDNFGCSPYTHRNGGVYQSLKDHGKRLRHHASKLSLSSSAFDGEQEHHRRENGTACANHNTSDDCDCKKLLSGRASISSPTGFTHVTHAFPQQFSNIGLASDSDLIADFSAVRAGQVSRKGLRGIAARDLHCRNSSEISSPSTIRSETNSLHSSAVPSLDSEITNDSLQSSNRSSQSTLPDIRKRPSKDSFSQPFVTRKSPSPTPYYVVPPPRTSSRSATRRKKSSLAKDSDNASIRSCPVAPSGVYAGVEDDRPASTTLFYHGAVDYPDTVHAVSTDGDIAWHVGYFPQSFETSLESVYEEESLAVCSNHPLGYFPTGGVGPNRENVRNSLTSSSSTSEDSTRTITPSMVHGENREQMEQARVYPASVETTKNLTPVQRASMQRSSINNGLFSSWKVDDGSDSDDHTEDNLVDAYENLDVSRHINSAYERSDIPDEEILNFPRPFSSKIPTSPAMRHTTHDFAQRDIRHDSASWDGPRRSERAVRFTPFPIPDRRQNVEHDRASSNLNRSHSLSSTNSKQMSHEPDSEGTTGRAVFRHGNTPAHYGSIPVPPKELRTTSNNRKQETTTVSSQNESARDPNTKKRKSSSNHDNFSLFPPLRHSTSLTRRHKSQSTSFQQPGPDVKKPTVYRHSSSIPRPTSAKTT